jgi:hypothetical protein
MKEKMTPLAYPTTKEEENRWGFDVYKPESTPMAWVLDWKSASAGFGVTAERTKQVAQFKSGEDLSQLTVDDCFAGHSFMFKLHWHTTFKAITTKYGLPAAMDIAWGLGYPLGERGWKLLQERFGSPVPLEKIVWYQDIAHLLYGPDTHAYSWCDERKSVCSRTRCLFRPPEGMEECAAYCRHFDTAYIDAYMAVEPKLLCVRVPDLGEKGKGHKCVHMWTYDRKVVEALPDKLKSLIPDSTKKLLEKKGVRL